MNNMSNEEIHKIIEAFATVHAQALYGESSLYPKKRQEVIDMLTYYNLKTPPEVYGNFIMHFVEGNYDLEDHDEYGLYAMNTDYGGDLSEHPKYEQMIEEMEDNYAKEIVLPVVEKTLGLTLD